MNYTTPAKEDLPKVATLVIAAYVVPQFQIPFRAQLLHKDVNPTEFNKHWLQYLTGERKAMRHVGEALYEIMVQDLNAVPQGLSNFFTVAQQLLNVENEELRRKHVVNTLLMHFDMLHTQRRMFENTIKDCVQIVTGDRGLVAGHTVREVEDVIFATAITQYIKEAAEQAAEEQGTTEEETNNE